MGKETGKRDKGRMTERRETQAMKDGERDRQTETEQKEATTENIRKKRKNLFKTFFKWTALINHYRSVTSTFVSIRTPH